MLSFDIMVKRGIVFLGFVLGLVNGALADCGGGVCYINSDFYVDSIDFAGDVVVGQNAVLDSGSINFVSSGTINVEEGAVIDGVVNVCDNCVVYVKNNGQINASYNLGTGASVVQIVDSVDSVQPIGTLENYDVVINSDTTISLDTVRGKIPLAGRIIIDNTDIVLSDADVKDLGMNLELRGDVNVYLRGGFTDNRLPILSNVSGDAVVRVVGADVDPMFRAQAVVRDNALYLDLVRNTDYEQIFPDSDLGVFINSLRQDGSASDLINALDRATTFDELQDIMSESVRFNPVDMMVPVRNINYMVLGQMGTFKPGIGIRPIALFSGDYDAYGAMIDVAGRVNDFSFSLSVYAGSMNVASEMDVYESALYGGNVHIGYNYEHLFARAIFGMTLARFDIGDVYDGGDIVNNPTGFSIYSAADLGARFDFSNNFYVAPFVRAGYEWYQVGEENDSDALFGMGLDFMRTDDDYDVQYEYGARVSATLNGIFDATARISFVFEPDGTAGHIGAGVIYDEYIGTIGFVADIGGNIRF